MKWIFPNKNVIFLKMELAILLVIGSLIFFLTLLTKEGFLFAFLFTLLFLLIYGVTGYILKNIFLVEHKYELTSTHLHSTTKSRWKTNKEKIPLKKIYLHKVDKYFLGGYALSNKGKHLLYFNNKKDHKKFEKHMKKHGKKR
tara:strand:- start:58947 stop:59372 length:426 start_codon:yes stop_codon:yes gene_type:complete